MNKIATIALLLAVAGCATPPAAPVVAGPPDPAAPFRPACAARWQSAFAIEKCALDELERSRSGATPVGATSAGVTPAGATPAPATPAAGRTGPAGRP